MSETILIVGAGAVGQVFAGELQRAGVHLSFFIKPEHPVPSLFKLLPQGRPPVVLAPIPALTDIGEVSRTTWDQVWITVPTPSLRGPWLSRLLSATGNSTIVAFAPESAASIPAERLVLGSIPFIAWQNPLPGQQGESGVAYWIPPFARVPVSGNPERVQRVLALLHAGQLPGKRVRDTARASAPLTVLLMALVGGLEAAGWSFQAFRGKWPRLSGEAAREALRICETHPAWRLFAHGWFLRTVLRVGALTVPFDLETYLRFHFTKVGAQTRWLFAEWSQRGRQKQLPVSAMESLSHALSS